MRDRSAVQFKGRRDVSPLTNLDGTEKQIKQEFRLRQMGLKDVEDARRLNGGKVID